MRISVCIATYNGGKYIREQLQSILSQLSAEDEIIISDDHSVDQTIAVVESFHDPRIKIFYNQGERGYTRNFENALMKAAGRYIFMSDQDDVWLDGKVTAVLEQLHKYPFVVTDAQVVDGDLNPLFPSHFQLNAVKKGFLHNFSRTRYIGACMAFRRSVLEKALPLPKRQELCAYDYWLAIVAELYFSVGLLETPYLCYRRHADTASNGGLEKSRMSVYHKVMKRLYCGYHLARLIFKKPFKDVRHG